jgi:hypothetical protein
MPSGPIASSAQIHLVAGAIPVVALAAPLLRRMDVCKSLGEGSKHAAVFRIYGRGLENYLKFS